MVKNICMSNQICSNIQNKLLFPKVHLYSLPAFLGKRVLYTHTKPNLFYHCINLIKVLWFKAILIIAMTYLMNIASCLDMLWTARSLDGMARVNSNHTHTILLKGLINLLIFHTYVHCLDGQRVYCVVYFALS